MLVPGNRLCGFASALPKVSNILIVNFRITIFSIYIILKGFLHLSGYIQIERKYAFTRNICSIEGHAWCMEEDVCSITPVIVGTFSPNISKVFRK